MEVAVISIMMPAYNAEKYIGEAIESVLAQSYPHWELIIVNDGSTDKTASIIAQFTDPRIKVVHQLNSGEAAARNTALKHMRGEYLAFLDADDLYLPGHLEITVSYLSSYSPTGGVYTDGYYCDQNGILLQPLSSRRRGPFEGRIFEEVLRSSDVFGPPICVVLRRSIILQYQLDFDPKLIIGPDWDFLTRYSDLAQFGYIDKSTCLYRVHETNISLCVNVDKRAEHMARCREKAIKMENFKVCSVETRTFVFYDLLINLLHNNFNKQSEVIKWQEFRELPKTIRARLLRLMSSKAILEGGGKAYIWEWISNSRKLNPSDIRSALLITLYFVNPKLCQRILRFRTINQAPGLHTDPFHDLHKIHFNNYENCNLSRPAKWWG